MSHDVKRKATVIVSFASLVLIGVALTSGMGVASIFEAMNRDNSGILSVPVSTKVLTIDQSNKTLVQKEKVLPPTLKVEIVRNGAILCEAYETPTINTSKSFTEYSLTRPVSGCPDLAKGDIVKATWVFRNEVEVSSR